MNSVPANSVLVFSLEFLNRVLVGLGEVPAKFSKVVIDDIERQVNLANTDPRLYVELVEKHLAPYKEKVAALDAAKSRDSDKPVEVAGELSDAA